MGLDNFCVLLDNTTNAFFPGQVVSGRVIIALSNQKNTSAVKIELHGEGTVHWTETETDTSGTGNDRRTETRTEHYRNSEIYDHQEIVLHFGPSLPPGTHHYPFSFVLKTGIPSSFVGEHGRVLYMTQATIVRSWKWNHRTKTYFTVNSLLDLNQRPEARTPGHAQDMKKLCCWCCASGPISATIASNRIGFVPGERLAFSAEVDNKSNRLMDSSYVNLVETVTFRARTKSKAVSRIVANVMRGAIEPGDSDTWSNVPITIPALPPTNLGGGCNIIQVIYGLNFHVDPSGPSFDLVVRLPLLIGSIPLTDYFSDFTPSNFQPKFSPPGGAGRYGAPPPDPDRPQLSAPNFSEQFSSYPDLPPPSYAESVWGQTNVKNEDDEFTSGNMDFAPTYLVYNAKNK